jgi:hypothetical protein
MYSGPALSPVMTLFAYRLTGTRELAVTAVPGKRRNATWCHMVKEVVQLQAVCPVMRKRRVETTLMQSGTCTFTQDTLTLASVLFWARHRGKRG